MDYIVPNPFTNLLYSREPFYKLNLFCGFWLNDLLGSDDNIFRSDFDGNHYNLYFTENNKPFVP